MAPLIKSLFTISALFVSHSLAALVARNDGPTSPPCSVPFTPYLYAGCYSDPGSPRALAFSPVGLNKQNMTVETCTAVCKGNNFRYAGIEYYGECYCGDSIRGSPAADNACTFPCTGNKSETCGGNKLLSVYMDPTYPPSDSSNVLDYTPEGCYTEGYNGRAVAFRQDQLSSTNLTTEACLGACKSQNFPLAATEYGGECYCGVVLGNGTASAPDTDCSMKCNGDSTEICGGRGRLNLYVASDLMSTEPCSPFVLPPPIVKSSTTTSQPTSTSTSQTATSTSTTSTSQTTTSTSTTSSEAATTTTLNTTTPSAAASSSTTISQSTTSSTTSSTSTTSTTSSITSIDSSTSTTSMDTQSSSTSTTSTSSTLTTSATSSATSTDSSTSITSTDTPSGSTSTTSSTSMTSVPSSTTSTDSSTSITSMSSTSTTLSPSTTRTPSSTISTDSSNTSPSTTSQTTTATSSMTTSPTSSKVTTPSTTKCTTTTAPAPTCEYGCGKWCSKPIPIFSDQPTCRIAVAECILQIADCFLSAGWPASLQCAKYQSWCQSISTYCGNICPGGKCSKSDCISKNPPVGGQTTTSTTVNVCPATSSSTATTSSTAPIPTVSSICVLPNGPSGSGYSNGNCVGDIRPPALTCNNLAKDFVQYPIKLYTSKESSECSGYTRTNVPQACSAACLAQYNSCVGTYATGCQGQVQQGDQDSYDSAKGKCTNQYNDCLAINKGTSAGNRCTSFGVGWS